MNVADPMYCAMPFDAPCMKPEVWAAWAQAVLSVAAIAAAERFASRRERKELSRKTDVYVNLLSMAEIRCHSLAMYTPGDVRTLRTGKSVNDYQIRDMEQFAAAFRAITLQDVPDYRLLPPLRDAADTCQILVEHLSGIDGIKPMSITDESMHIGKEIKHAQWRLNQCYLQAAEVSNEYAIPSLSQRWHRIKLALLARFSRPRS